MNRSSTTLNVHSIESFGTHDGPGIRMVVFLQGCNLKCLYCHNPDTIALKGGEAYTIEELVRRACNLRPYFGHTGGVTISGGEPLLQSKNLYPLFAALKQEGIHTNIDTNGSVFNQDVKRLLDDLTDLVMIDIKHTNQHGYKLITGVTDRETVQQLVAHREASQKPFWLRYVLVPGLTDAPEELHRLGQTYQHCQQIEKIELQPYHKLGIHKWEAMGEAYQLMETPENTQEQILKAQQILEKYFKTVKIN